MKCHNLCRDEIPDFRTRPDTQWISFDHNDDGNPERHVEGIEIRVPEDATDEHKWYAQMWVQGVKRFFDGYGHNVPVRRGNGLIIGGRGIDRVTHLEPFFADDKRSMQIITDHAAEFIAMTMFTIGRMPGATFILPHKSTDPGVTHDGYNEREFARYILMPHTIRWSGGETPIPTQVQYA